MVAHTSDEETDELVEQVCALFGIGQDDHLLVHSLLGKPKAAWPTCCDSACDVCMATICSAATEILRRKRSKAPVG